MNAIKLSNLTKIYKKGFRKKKMSAAVKNISFEVKSGSIFGLLGPNGAGKTSIVKMMSGLLTPTEGNISIYGKKMNGQISYVRSITGALLEGNRSLYWPLTLKENLTYFGRIKFMKKRDIQRRSNELIEIMGLEKYENHTIAELSTGNRQKASLAAAIIHEPKLLLLDEPTIGLDVHASKKLKEIIKDYVKCEDKTVFLTTHDMRLAQEICDEFLILKEGEINKQFDRSEFEQFSDAFTYMIEVQPRYNIAAAFNEHISLGFPFKDQLIEYKASEKSLIVTFKTLDLLPEIINWIKTKDYVVTDIKKQEIKLEDIILNLEKANLHERRQQDYTSDASYHMG